MSGFLSPAEIASAAAESGVVKSKMSISKLLVLGFLAGAFIALGALLDIRVTAGMPKAWGTFNSFVGAAVFPVGLMLCIIAGAELLTGNMATVPIAWHSKKIKFSRIFYNWLWVTIGNFVGSVFVAYFFGILAHTLNLDPFKTTTIAIATAKAHLPYMTTIASAVGCNWLVALAVWLAIGAKDIVSKMVGIWFPIMAFVAIGFQHVVANMFFIPAGIFVGAQISWGEAFTEFSAAFIGNAIGAWLFVASIYYFTYLRSSNSKLVTETKAQVATSR